MSEHCENIKTEDILSDDLLYEKVKEDRQLEKTEKSEAQLLAVDILDVLVARKESLTPDERNDLENRIQASIHQQRFLKVIVWRSVAAVFVLLIGLTWFFKASHREEIRQFAEGVTVHPTTNTQLILKQDNVIAIESQDSKITYAANGEEIHISSNRESVVLPNSVMSSDNINLEKTYSMVVVPYGRRSCVTLPDSSVVWLNSGSKLTYPAHFEKNKREVVLEGEAMFDVDHDASRPFFVLTKDVDVRVIGTVFCVSAYADDNVVSTVLQEGAVELSMDSSIPGFKKKTRMVPGMKADYLVGSRSIRQYEVDPREYTSWKDGYLMLKNSSLEGIGKRISRYYNVKIEFQNEQLKEETFSGYLDLKGSAKEVLDIITEITGNRVDEQGGVLLIRNK